MKSGGIIFLILVAAVSAAPCSFQINELIVGTQPSCPDGLPIEHARVYINEEYYICGQIDQNSGKITAYEPSVMEKQTVAISNGKFQLQGKANTEQHKVHYIETNYTDCELKPIMLSIKEKCDQTIQKVEITPENAIYENSTFTIKVEKPEKDFELIINQLNLEAELEKNQPWQKTFLASECCENPPCKCELEIQFSEKQHPICQDTTNFEISVKKKKPETPENTEYLLAIALTLIVVIGTTALLLYNRNK